MAVLSNAHTLVKRYLNQELGRRLVLNDLSITSLAAAGGYVPESWHGGGKILSVLATEIQNVNENGSGAGARATGTITFSDTGEAADTVTIGAIKYQMAAAPSAPTDGSVEVDIGGSATVSARNLAAAINLGTNATTFYAPDTAYVGHPTVRASEAAGVVTLTARREGTAGNIALTQTQGSNSHVAISGSALTGGVDQGPLGSPATGEIAFQAAVGANNDTLTVGNRVYNFEASPTAYGDVDIKADGQTQAAELASVINAGDALNPPHEDVKASNSTAADGLVLLTARVRGTDGLHALAKSAGLAEATVSGTALVGGSNPGGGSGLSGFVRTYKNSQTVSITEDDDGDLFVSHGGDGTRTVRVVFLTVERDFERATAITNP